MKRRTVEPSDTFTYTDGTDEHLWFVISSTAIECTVVANLTTSRSEHEEACIQNVGDHAFVRHKSVIYYRGAQIVSVANLNEMLNVHQIMLREKADKEVLVRILEGAEKSKFIPPVVREFLTEQGLISKRAGTV